MATLLPIQPNEATGEAKALFDDILQRLPRVPNMLARLAHSPTVLASYLAFTESFNSQLPERLRDLTSITVAQVTGGDYILSFAHALAKREGISEEQMNAARRGEAGYTDADLVAIVAYISFSVFRVYFNLMAQTAIDFPVVKSADLA